MTQPLPYAALFTLAIVWALALRFRPPTFAKHGGTASNYPWGIAYNSAHPYKAAILAQEIYELRFKWLCLIFFVFLFRRGMELQSHAIECAAAETLYGADLNTYMAGEARSMVGYYPWLKDMTPAEIEAEMRKRLPKARKWVAANRSILERYV